MSAGRVTDEILKVIEVPLAGLRTRNRVVNKKQIRADLEGMTAAGPGQDVLRFVYVPRPVKRRLCVASEIKPDAPRGRAIVIDYFHVIKVPGRGQPHLVHQRRRKNMGVAQRVKLVKNNFRRRKAPAE